MGIEKGVIDNGIGQSYEISYKDIILDDKYNFLYKKIDHAWLDRD